MVKFGTLCERGYIPYVGLYCENFGPSLAGPHKRGVVVAISPRLIAAVSVPKSESQNLALCGGRAI